MTGGSWDDLLATALVGTERRALAATTTADLAAVLGVADAGAVAAPAAEQQVLAAAGVLSAWRRAGWRPPRSERPPPEAAPPDGRPVASPAAVQLLELLLAGQVPLLGGAEPLVAEWLRRCAAAGRRLPDAVLPRLLAVGSSVPFLRDPVVAAGGPRLRWLAARNEGWAWAAGPAAAGDGAAAGPPLDAGEAWATGDRDARVRLLARLRRDDPAAGRTLLEGTWLGEAAADRVRFLELLATGLGDGDEPFLEAALDDRARNVRAVAAGLLASLPSSRLAARMAARLTPLVRVGGRLRRRLEVDLPDEVDKSARRDGVTDDGAPAAMGRRSWWLVQLVAAAPLPFWERHLGLPPEEIVRLGRESAELRAGWVRAATRQRDATWARLLLREVGQPELLAALPPGGADAELAALVARAPDAAFGTLVQAAVGPWSAAASRAVLARARSLRQKLHVSSIQPVLALRLDPATLPEVEQWIGELRDDEYARRQVRALAHTLSIRATIAQELR